MNPRFALAGIVGAADELTAETFIAAIEEAGEFTFASSGPGSFSPDDRSGVDEFRTIQWDATGCECWQPIDEFRTFSELDG